MSKSSALRTYLNPWCVAVCPKYDCESWGMDPDSPVKVWAQLTKGGPWRPVLEDCVGPENKGRRFCAKCQWISAKDPPMVPAHGISATKP